MKIRGGVETEYINLRVLNLQLVCIVAFIQWYLQRKGAGRAPEYARERASRAD